MATIIEQKETSIIKERRVMNFTAVTRPGELPSVVAVFGEVLKDIEGNVININPQTYVLHIPYARLTGAFPNYGINSFVALYTGLSAFIHDEYTATVTIPSASFKV